MTLKTELETLHKTIMKESDNLDSLIDKMLSNIGTVDPELRDKLIFNTFGKLITENYLSNKQMEHILKVCLELLFFDIGQKEDDSVFTRSFSALVIGLIVEKDRKESFLSKEYVDQAIEASVEYLNSEQDIRGYVNEKGWAHSIAHGADLLTEAVKHPQFSLSFLSECLIVIKNCLFKEGTADIPYVDEEEERLIFAVEALIEKGLSEKEVEVWLFTISNELKNVLEEDGYSLTFFRKKTIVITFLRAFYFRLLFKNDGIKLREMTANILKEWHINMYE
ncbi:DUF2785 domain-containing protein [Radiobacillus deserti]|uniref:DUF2785 domain-containing protein n=1 Tax=Radiobacillus deserti TaxID=2594883 RepID=A0A516KIC0_9BACI|nr:DUF2785 domain-containing protein [Radiobacillus deserti]QDP41145.1 DUF2785 domain-containing protein [Radiobacillus deserti]